MKIDPNAYRVRAGDDVDLGKWPTPGKPLCKSNKAYRKLLQEQVDQLSDYQELLHASNSHALLLIFQAAGKDGAKPQLDALAIFACGLMSQLLAKH